jgi:hypothetical protein
MKKNIFLSVIIFFILFSSGRSLAQDTLHSRFGIALGMTSSSHSANFNALPGIPGNSTNFSTGYGNGFAANLLYEYPINDFLLISACLGFLDHSATLISSTGQTSIFVNGTTKTGDFWRSLDVIVSTFGFEPRVGIRVFKGLIISAGLRIGFPLSPKYIIRDTTSQGTFPNTTGKDSKSGVRNQYAGALPNAASVLLHGVISIAYEFPLNRKHTTFIVPEITYTPALNDLVKGLDWKTNAVIFGIALKFSLN